MNCLDCGRPGVPFKLWRRSSEHRRRAWLAEGVKAIEGRGLCRGCYKRARCSGQLERFERRNARHEDLLEAWSRLADPMKPISTEAIRLSSILGRKPRTIEAALYRSGVRSRWSPTALPPGWTEETLREEWEFLADRTRPIEDEAERLGPRLDIAPRTLASAIRRLGVHDRRPA